MVLVTFFVVTQTITVGTAVFADNREKEELIPAYAGEKSELQMFKEESINMLAETYNVEKEYLYYIAEVEKMFELEPYELLALIAQESGFIPQTKMDGGSYSYSTTQMKLDTAKTAYMAITDYYN